VVLGISLARAVSNRPHSQFEARAKTCMLRQRSISAFNSRMLHSIGVRFGFVIRFVSDTPFFVFNVILASVVLFLACFKPSLIPQRRGTPRYPAGCPASGACLRQYVPKKTTIIGYRITRGLSSEKCAAYGDCPPLRHSAAGDPALDRARHGFKSGCRYQLRADLAPREEMPRAISSHQAINALFRQCQPTLTVYRYLFENHKGR